MVDDHARTVRLWAAALSTPDDEAKLAPLREALAENVTAVSALGTTQGKEAVLETFGRSPIAEQIAQGTWSDPTYEDGAYTMVCTFPQGPMRGISVRISLDEDGRIAHVETTLLQAPPPEPQPVRLGEEIAEAVNGALLAGAPVVVAYVDAEGRPHLSLRGSVQVHTEDQLAMWIRNPEGGLLKAIGNNPHLTFFYRNTATRTTYQFYGRGRVESDERIRDAVYTRSPEPERRRDEGRRGVAVIVDVDRVEGRGPDGPVLMDRSAS